MEIVWAKVKGQEAIVLIEKLKAANPRRDRHQRRAYNKLVLKAAKLGLLVRVPTQPVLEGKPVEMHLGVTGGGKGTNEVPTP